MGAGAALSQPVALRNEEPPSCSAFVQGIGFLFLVSSENEERGGVGGDRTFPACLNHLCTQECGVRRETRKSCSGEKTTSISSLASRNGPDQ